MTRTVETLPNAFPVDRAPAETPPVHLHIPTPGDHYSPATGSAVMTVIHAIACEHAAVGGETRLLVSRGTRHDYEVGGCQEVEPTTPPRRWQKAIDIGVARAGGRRFFTEKTYRPFGQAIPPDFEGCVFVHNGPEAVRAVRARAPRAQVILWMHNPVFQHYARHEIERIESSLDRIVGVSGVIARSVETRLGRASSKIRVVHNGVDTRRFQPIPKPRDSGPCVILFVGRIQPIKGADLLLKAACLLAVEGLDFRVRVVGSSGFDAGDSLTDYECRLRDLARPLGDRVTFRPFANRKEVVQEYHQATIFCAPSNWEEPFGLTVAEAMACGLPVVASRRGGIPEFAGDNVLYFKPPDVDELATRLRFLIQNPAAREAFGASAHAAARQLDWSCSYRNLLAALGR
ncbi:MAG: spore coat protein [Chthoniobacter sp.]|jgi:glycosyltransferase involved in cell wall biosynthesis|nr:spore coat protein [Chthoniobacter sp.]